MRLNQKEVDVVPFKQSTLENLRVLLLLGLFSSVFITLGVLFVERWF